MCPSVSLFKLNKLTTILEIVRCVLVGVMDTGTLEKELEDVTVQLNSIQEEIDHLLEQQELLQQRKTLLVSQLDELARGQARHYNSLQKDSGKFETETFVWSGQVQYVLENSFKLKKFRPMQLSCVNATLANYDVILVMPTGGGKSLCYQLPAIIDNGFSLVISPLVSLMQDQMMSLDQLGIISRTLNAHSSKEDVKNVHSMMLAQPSTLKLLFVTPEKLAKSKQFMSKLQKANDMKLLSRIVIDEIHCTSQWGHDFRPDYKFLGILKRQFPTVPLLGLTATATEKVLEDIKKILGIKNCLVFKTSYNRPNLFYEVVSKPTSHKAQIEEMVSIIKGRFRDQSGIVYCFSCKDTEQLSDELRANGIKSACYHANLTPEARTQAHSQWVHNTVQVVVATIAFGMGIDKPDVRFVIHHSLSKSVENYYQESGRAGRDGLQAHCIIYYRNADVFKQSCMVFTEQTGLHNLYKMLRYCLEQTECRRAFVARHFGEHWSASDCDKMCDICSKQGHCSTDDVTTHAKTVLQLVEKATSAKERLTFLKLLELWRGQGNILLTVESCEHVIMNMLLEGVLKEDFHFTPYSTISYLVVGPRANAIKTGRLSLSIRVSAKSSPYFTGAKSVTPSSCKSQSKNKPQPGNKPQCSSTSAVGTSRSFIEADKMATTVQQPATDSVPVKRHRKKQLYTGRHKKGVNFDSSGSEDSDDGVFQVTTIKRPHKDSSVIIVDSD